MNEAIAAIDAIRVNLNSAVSELDAKTRRINEYRREASRLSSKANKRIERLEANGLKDTPAYQRYLADGGKRFGVKGKTYNQVQSEVARLNRFIESQTSTVRGANQVLKDIAKNTKIQYKDMKDLRSKAPKFFELASKVEQYLRVVEDMASAINYNKIWEAVNTYTQAARVDLSDSTLNIDEMIEAVSKALTTYDSTVQVLDGFYPVKDFVKE